MTCTGHCSAGWLTRWHPISGRRTNATTFVHTVPMGQLLEQADLRREGVW